MRKTKQILTSQAQSQSPWRHLPNGLSLLRVACIPVVVWLSLTDQHFAALVVFLAGALTDFLDGWLANRFQWHTRFGSYLDPVVDRLYILCLIPLLWHFGAISSTYTVLVIVRFTIQLSAFPVLLGWLKKNFYAKPGWLSRSAMLIAFLVLGMGFADQIAIERFDESSAAENIFDSTMEALTVIGCILEIWVLIKFVPRYWDIIRGRADTFE
ncbi:CDP-alcohol phosphatidyltransferase family protein [Microbulbifer elongatus]|uniref:CDP-diacylglycerol--glycerol-3-phosphate 3-phosphatidyltransferase n=1 Tax=Microbulbifer elongatus TaxID=86173 RepID=A0ABT1P1G2_9GAMM|nr:CDP-alcohol phosphatidyltransferase family protein [Microbulbifer elongatus]MCQ3829938.1 CDP-alcohol phosphatidyltransferase family protein [Microbulbifer elongatus]